MFAECVPFLKSHFLEPFFKKSHFKKYMSSLLRNHYHFTCLFEFLNWDFSWVHWTLWLHDPFLIFFYVSYVGWIFLSAARAGGIWWIQKRFLGNADWWRRSNSDSVKSFLEQRFSWLCFFSRSRPKNYCDFRLAFNSAVELRAIPSSQRYRKLKQ